MILEVKDKDGAIQYPTGDEKPVGKKVASPQAAYIITDILGGQHRQVDQPDLGRRGRSSRRPRTAGSGARPPTRPVRPNDRKDTAAFGYLAAPEDEDAPALVVGVWMGNSDSTPEQRRAVARARPRRSGPGS